MKNLSQIAGKPRPKGGGVAVTPARKSQECGSNTAVVANPAAGSCDQRVPLSTAARAAVPVESGKEASK